MKICSTTWTAMSVALVSLAASLGCAAEQPGSATGASVVAAASDKLPADKLEGLYFTMVHAFGSWQQDHYFFSRDGQVLRGVPKGGLDNFDWARARKEMPDAAGTYEIQGDKLVLKMANGKESKIDFAREKDGNLTLDGIFASKCDSFKPGEKLDGIWGWAGGAGGGTGAVVAAGHSITLRPDGTFEESRVGGAKIVSGGETKTAKSEGATTGSYELGGNTLTLKHKSGETTKHTVYPYEMEKDDIRLNFDGAMHRSEK